MRSCDGLGLSSDIKLSQSPLETMNSSARFLQPLFTKIALLRFSSDSVKLENTHQTINQSIKKVFRHFLTATRRKSSGK